MTQFWTWQVTARSAAALNEQYRDAAEYQLAVTAEKAEAQPYSPAQEWILTLQNNSPAIFNGVVRLALAFKSASPKFFMPAFLYNKNRGDVPPYYSASGQTALFPRMRQGAETPPCSSWWQVRGDRLSHPVVMACENHRLLGIAASPLSGSKCVFNGFYCNWGEAQSSIGITLGYENAPWLYLDSHTLCPRSPALEKTSILLAPGQKKRVAVQVYALEQADELSVNTVLRDVYRRYHQPPRKAATLETVVENIAEAIFTDAYTARPAGYATRVMLKGGTAVQEPLASISWTGGVEVAVPMLYAAARLKRPDMRAQALTVVQNMVSHSLNPAAHLPFDAYDENHWYTNGWWDEDLKQSGHSSYLVGQALYYLLRGYELEKTGFGVDHLDWLAFAEECLTQAEATKNSSGEVPHLWSAADGTPLEYDSFSGCWCVAAQACWCLLTGDTRWLPSCETSVHHYYDAYVRKMECYGTPHDTFKAVDSEGVLAFIKACRVLHQLTQKPEYLTMLGHGLEYEFTFKFCWNPPIQAEPLKKIGWSACGGSVTSTCNPHIHPMSNNVTDEIAYLWQQTNDPYFLQRLTDTVQWALQTCSTFDGEYDFGKKGWMSERFCYSEGLLTERYENGDPCSTWRCFLPWGASNLLEGLCGTAWETRL